jgi:hypothetical protein
MGNLRVVRWIAVVLSATLIAAGSLSCGSKQALDPASASTGAGPRLVMESEFGSLPALQQKLLSDPGWNQPYIAPREGTPVEPPALPDLSSAPLAQPAKSNLDLAPWLCGATAAKRASGDGQIERGELVDLAPDATPAFGCNGNPANASDDGFAIEDIIAANSEANLPSFFGVAAGIPPMNYFNQQPSSERSGSTYVYQLNTDAVELTGDHCYLTSYASRLVPAGAPGSGCDTAGVQAYTITGAFYDAFNTYLQAAPSLMQIPVYNVLVAPRGPRQGPFVSSSQTTGYKQDFYFADNGDCFGGAWIVGLTASSSGCQKFDDWFKPANYQASRWHQPIYGVHLKRWQELAPPEAAGPWESELGWPVYGPVAQANGAAQLGLRGTYYIWDLWFERGFIRWVDYDNNPGGAYPNVPDEAHAYRWVGEHVYSPTDRNGHLERIGLPQYYGGSGPLGVGLSLDCYRNSAAEPWRIPHTSTGGLAYEIELPASEGIGQVELKLTAQGFGGVPGSDPAHPENGDCLYKYYTWAFHDGSVQVAGEAFDPAQRIALHTYTGLQAGGTTTYVVRVQVTDANDVIAYTDSLPIVLSCSSHQEKEVLLIRDDAPGFDVYNTNYNALKADLDAIGVGYDAVNYTDTVAADFAAGGYRVAIWYRGGPGSSTEPDYVTKWTDAEEANFNALLSQRMLLVSQAHGAMETDEGPWNYFGLNKDPDPDSLKLRSITDVLMTHETDQNMGLTSNEKNWYYCGWLSVFMGSDLGAGQEGGGHLFGGLPGLEATLAAERVGATLPNGSGVIPGLWDFGTGAGVKQFCPRGCKKYQIAEYANPGWTKGIQANPDGTGGWYDGCRGAAMLSYGNASSGGAAWNVPGPGRFWCIGVAYVDYKPVKPERSTSADMLQNVLAWLDQGLAMES